jgi:hypothetical protein
VVIHKLLAPIRDAELRVQTASLVETRDGIDWQWCVRWANIARGQSMIEQKDAKGAKKTGTLGPLRSLRPSVQNDRPDSVRSNEYE